MNEVVGIEHRFFKSRSDFGYLAAGRGALAGDAAMLRGYLLGLETSAAVCRSHIISAVEKFGVASEGVRIGRADLCCIEREIRRARAMMQALPDLQMINWEFAAAARYLIPATVTWLEFRR